MNKTGILLCCAVFCGCAAVYAETPDAAQANGTINPADVSLDAHGNNEQVCRVGVVTAAEISTVKPVIKGWNPSEDKIDNCVFAEIRMNLFPYRGISRFDFKLSEKYPCIAVAKKLEPYSGEKEKWVIPPLSKDKKTNPHPVRLLFAIPKADVKGLEGTKNFKLTLHLISGKYPSSTISFRILPIGTPFGK